MTHCVFCFVVLAGKLNSKLMLDAITILSQVLVSIMGSILRDLIYIQHPIVLVFLLAIALISNYKRYNSLVYEFWTHCDLCH